MVGRLYQLVGDVSPPFVGEIRKKNHAQVKWTTCVDCGLLWWASKHGHGIPGFAKRCVSCGSKYSSAMRIANVFPIYAFRLLDAACGERACSLCNRVRRIEDFYRRSREPSIRCKDCELVYRVQNNTRIRMQQREYYLSNRDKMLQLVLNRQNSFRKSVIVSYGGKCDCCRESTYDFLTVDHVNGYDKNSGTPRAGQKLVEWLVKNNYPDGYRILCFNCNSGREYNRGICPHSGEIRIEKLQGNRVCCRCRERLSKTMFSVNRRNYDGLETICRSCNSVYNKSVKRDAIFHYSDGTSSCKCCGEKNLTFLNIDHVNNNGYVDRKSGATSGSKFAARLRKLGWPIGYQILCFNCNWSKFTGKGICAHQKNNFSRKN